MNAAEFPTIFRRLVLYHQVMETGPGMAMYRFLSAVATGDGVVDSYLDLVRAMYATPSCPGPAPDPWQNHLLAGLLRDENPFSMGAASGDVAPETLVAGAYDLRLIQRCFQLTGPACRHLVGDPYLPTWPSASSAPDENPASRRMWAMASELVTAEDWGALAPRLAAYYRQAGAGLTGSSWYLRWTGQQLEAIPHPTLSSLDDLVGLSTAKATVLQNTEQFLRGARANNLLLYGSRGTGKSSMVRGLASKYGSDGLRLVEVGRASLGTLGELFRVLIHYPQRFVLFLDDLSFEAEEADFKSFKSVLEGALEQQPSNVLLYATSNRRHLVPERWTDRHTPDTAEIHGQDAMEEKLSLADRFGMTVLFAAPNQDEYLAIVGYMAQQRGLPISREALEQAALHWVMWNNPRSGRAARQFIDDLAGRLNA